MKASLEQIRAITLGAVSVVQNGEEICFYRFTEAQKEMYRRYNEEFWQKTFSTAGIKFSFETDSPWLFLDFHTRRATSRTYFSVDVLVNGVYTGSVDNHSDKDISGDYSERPFPQGRFGRRFELGGGRKHVLIHLPWSVEFCLNSLSLKDGSEIIPVRPEKKVIIFGDSITHGYDALYAKNRYAAQAADALKAEEVNKAIGGEIFHPELAAERDAFEPDYILAAYGTNDWGTQTWESFSEKCPAFYRALAEAYPKARIFALSPIWRKDHEEVRQCCGFRHVDRFLREATREFANITVIDCFDFVPKDSAYFSDFRLHPNDSGFEHYGRNLAGVLKRKVYGGAETESG